VAVSALAVDRLTVRLPRGAERGHAVRAASFTLERGRTLCLVGESGSGKSMIANALLGLLPEGVVVESGRVVLDGRDLLALSERERARLRGNRIALVPQEPLAALNPVMRIGEHLAEVFEAHGRRAGARTGALLEEVGLADPVAIARAYPFELSGGQRQRVLIAMALALEPAVLIADEPTTALDVTTEAEILALLRRLREAHGMAVLFITHDFGVVAEIADDVAVMETGVIVEAGPADAVLGRPRHETTRRLLAAVPSTVVPPAAAPRDVPLLSVEGLSKTYASWGPFGRRRTVRAVDDVSFTIGRGEVLALVGDSGSGNSTLGGSVVRLLAPDGGRVRLGGEDILTLTGPALRRARRRIQMVFQDPYASLNPRVRVARTVAQGPIAAGTPVGVALADARRLLRTVGLDDAAGDRYPAAFSGGQRQRIAIARALALRPELVVADEAASALDVSVQAQILDLLQQLRSEFGLSLLFITHDLRVAASLADRVAVMRAGRIVEIGTTRDVFLAPKDEGTRRLLSAVPGARWSGAA
jgi:peptide/nickel transport system ATP-binding protein